MVLTALTEINLKEIYEQDFQQWLEITADLLKQKKLNDLDLENLIEEITAMGKSQKRELESRLIVLIMHLLKWQYQNSLQTKSWLYTIVEQRRQLKILLEQNPSLKPYLEQIIPQCYQAAREDASIETGLKINTFPEDNPFNLKQIFDSNFFPKAD